ncbi:MAG: hypothetical protein AAF666_20725 [Pseudomonadota bacterium]
MLKPWFGSGMFTWAAIISVTLFPRMIGYFLGGHMVDRLPVTRLLGFLVLVVAVSKANVASPLGMDEIGWRLHLGHELPVIIRDTLGARAIGATVATLAFQIMPVTMIACFSQLALRRLLVSTGAIGHQTAGV